MLQKKFGRRLAYLRKIKGMTQAELAEGVDVTVQHLGNLERGLSSPSFKVLEALCQVLGYEPANFFLSPKAHQEVRIFDNDPKKTEDCPDLRQPFTKAGIIKLDLQSQTWYASDSFFSMLGMPQSNTSPLKVLLKVVSENHSQKISDFIQGIDSDVKKWDLLFDVRISDGTNRHIASFWRSSHSKAGELLDMFAVLLDVTEWIELNEALLDSRDQLEAHLSQRTQEIQRKNSELQMEVIRTDRAKDLLTRSEEWHQQILNTAQTAISITGLDGGIKYINDACLQMFGIESLESVKKMNARDFWSNQEDRNRFIETLVDQGSVRNFEGKLRKTDGDVLDVLGSSVINESPQGERVIINSFLDISDRKQAETLLKESLLMVERRNLEVEGLLRGARLLLERGDFKTVSKRLFDACKEVTGATAGYVALLTPTGDENEVLFLDSGGRQCTVDPELPMPIRGLREVAYREKRVVFDNKFAESQWMVFMPEGHAQLDNVIFAPLIIDDKTVGLIGLANKVGGFDDRDAELVRAYADMAAVVLREIGNEKMRSQL